MVAVFLFFYHKNFRRHLWLTFCQAVGVKVSLYNLLIAVLIAVIIVPTMNLVGAF